MEREVLGKARIKDILGDMLTVTKFTLDSWEKRIEQINISIKKHRQKIENLDKERELLEKRINNGKENRGD